MRRLSKTKQRAKIPDLYGFDVETYDRNTKLACVSIVGDDKYEPLVFYDKSSFIKEIKKRKYAKSMFVATNLSFDFFQIFFSRPERKNFSYLEVEGRLLSAFTYIEDGKFTLEPRKKDHKITFIDTMNYAGISVEKQGKLIKEKKLNKPKFLGKKPQNPEEWKELVAYNIQDSRVSRKFLLYLYQGFFKLGASIKKTIASTSMSLFRNKYLNDTYYTHSEDVCLEIFKAFYGGRTEAFKRGHFQDGYYYDINSLYPYVMKKGVYPDPNTIKILKKGSIMDIMRYEGVSEVTIKCPKMRYPLLPVRTKDKLIFPCGIFSGTYTHVELRKAIDLGYKILDTRKTIYYRRNCRPFVDFVEDMYNTRLEYKQEENHIMSYITKILMNSLYGKFGQKFKGRSLIVSTDQLKIEDVQNPDKEVEILNESFARVKDSGKPAPFCVPEWASYITAYARLELYDYLVKYQGMYCDTDSIITKKEILNTSSKLGDMKLEMKIKECIIVRPKFYAVRSHDKDIVKIKGMPIAFNFDSFKLFLKNPYKKYDKFAGFREAVRRGFYPGELIETEKSLNLEDKKRDWKETFNPFHLQDSDPLYIEQNNFAIT